MDYVISFEAHDIGSTRYVLQVLPIHSNASGGIPGKEQAMGWQATCRLGLST